jgi:hypothetical protein
MDDSQKKFLRLPVKSSEELLQLLEHEQTVGWHGVSSPPPVEPPREEWRVLLEKVIHILQDMYALHDYETYGVSENAKEETW